METKRKRVNFHSKLRSLDLKPNAFHVFSLKHKTSWETRVTSEKEGRRE